MGLPATASGILRLPPNRRLQLRAASLAARLRKHPLPPGSSQRWRALDGIVTGLGQLQKRWGVDVEGEGG
jgi:hypothetical protein